MPRHIILLAALVALFVPSAVQAQCVSKTGPQSAMTTQTTGIWDGCTPAAGEDYVIKAGSVVTIAPSAGANIAMKSLTVDGGTLVVSPQAGGGVTLTIDEGLFLNGAAGGRFISQGYDVGAGEVTEVGLSTTNNAQTITVDFDVTNVVAGDSIWFPDALPDDANTQPIRVPVQIGPGPREPGKYRPQLARWTAYNIITKDIGNRTITFEIDEFEGSLGETYETNTYVGTRLPATTTGRAPTSVVAQRASGYTIITVGGAPDLVPYYGDYGGWFIEWENGACDGLVDKIIYSRGTENELWVSGNRERCFDLGTETITTTLGWRVGDQVRVTRFAKFDFDFAGEGAWDNTGTNCGDPDPDPPNNPPETYWQAPCAKLGDYLSRGIQWDISKVEIHVDRTKFMRIGANGGDVVGSPYAASPVSTPMLTNDRFNFIAYQTDCASNYSDTSSFTNNEIAFTRGGGDDTSVFGVMSANAAGTAPIGGTCLADLTGFNWSDNYLHDQVNETTGAGTGNHGIFHRSPGFIHIKQTRVSRFIDDLYGANLTALGLASAGETKGTHLILVEQKPPADSSESCWDAAIGSTIDTTGFLTSKITAREVFMSGCGGQVMFSGGNGNIDMRHAVVGGAYNPAIGTSGVNNLGSSGAALLSAGITGAQIDARQNFAENLIVFSAAEDGDASQDFASLTIMGELKNSIGFAPEHLTGLKLSASTLDGVYVPYANGTNTTPYYGGSGSHWVPETYTIKNSVILGYFGQLGLTQSVTAAIALGRTLGLSIEDSYITGSTFTSSPSGVLKHAWTDVTSAGLVNINGLVLRQIVSNTRGLGTQNGGTNNGALVQRACVESLTSLDFAGAYGANYTATSHHTGPNGPSNTDDAPIRAFVGQPGATGCQDYLPDYLGLSEAGYVGAYMGDGWNEQWEFHSSRADPTMGGGGGSGDGGHL